MASKFDLILLSGGSGTNAVKYHPDDYDEEIKFIREADRKIIGICLGCEIIATAFGCTLRKMPARSKGIYNINFGGQKYSVYKSHKFIIDKITEEVEVLAVSEDGVEMIKHKTKSIYGLQFHPEIYPHKTQGRAIFWRIIEDLFSKTK